MHWEDWRVATSHRKAFYHLGYFLYPQPFPHNRMLLWIWRTGDALFIVRSLNHLDTDTKYSAFGFWPEAYYKNNQRLKGKKWKILQCQFWSEYNWACISLVEGKKKNTLETSRNWIKLQAEHSQESHSESGGICRGQTSSTHWLQKIWIKALKLTS